MAHAWPASVFQLVALSALLQLMLSEAATGERQRKHNSSLQLQNKNHGSLLVHAEGFYPECFSLHREHAAQLSTLMFALHS